MDNVDYMIPLPKWVKPSKYAEMSGYTVDAIDSKRRTGVWLEDIHWTKAPDGKIFINWRKCDEWIEEVWVPHGKAV